MYSAFRVNDVLLIAVPSESVTVAVRHSEVNGWQSMRSPVPASTTEPVIVDSRGITPSVITSSRGWADVSLPALTSRVSTELTKPKYSVVSW